MAIQWNANDIKVLKTEANRGSAEALAELKAINRQVAKVANTRLRRLEQSDMDYWAYDKADVYLSAHNFRNKAGDIRFPEGQMGGSVKALENNIQAAIEFINAKTSTITGMKEARQKKIDALQEEGIDLSDDEDDRFLRFLGNDTISQIIKQAGDDDSDKIVAMIKKGIKTGYSYQGIKNMFDSMSAGESVSIDEISERLGSKKYLKSDKSNTQRNNKSTFYQRKKKKK